MCVLEINIENYLPVLEYLKAFPISKEPTGKDNEFHFAKLLTKLDLYRGKKPFMSVHLNGDTLSDFIQTP